MGAVANLYLNPKIVHELACGLEAWDDIMGRYGISLSEAAELKKDPYVLRAVESRRAELERTGYTFRTKARLMAEDLMAEVYLAAKDERAAPAFKLDVLKTMVKVGDLEPRPNAPGGANGPSFNISIDLGDHKVTLGAQPTTVDMEPLYDALDNPPPHIKSFQLPVVNDLEYE